MLEWLRRAALGARRTAAPPNPRRTGAGTAPSGVLAPGTTRSSPLSSSVAPGADLTANATSLTGAAAPGSAEARRVVGLFAQPSSLVAALIVGEVLAKPVALRDR